MAKNKFTLSFKNINLKLQAVVSPFAILLAFATSYILLYLIFKIFPADCYEFSCSGSSIILGPLAALICFPIALHIAKSKPLVNLIFIGAVIVTFSGITFLNTVISPALRQNQVQRLNSSQNKALVGSPGQLTPVKISNIEFSLPKDWSVKEPSYGFAGQTIWGPKLGLLKDASPSCLIGSEIHSNSNAMLLINQAGYVANKTVSDFASNNGVTGMKVVGYKFEKNKLNYDYYLIKDNSQFKDIYVFKLDPYSSRLNSEGKYDYCIQNFENVMKSAKFSK